VINYEAWRSGIAQGTRNPYVVETSEWWIWRLSRALEQQRRRMEVLDGYYRGTNDVFRLASVAAQASGIAGLFQGLNANLAKLIVDAPRQRLEVYGFRTAAGDVDEQAWAIWQANDMDTESATAHTEAMAKGYCPVLIEPNPAEPDRPTITVQDPLGMYVEVAAGDRRQVRAALKQWVDDFGRTLFTLYLPDRIERWQGTAPTGAISAMVQGVLGLTPRQFVPRQLTAGVPWRMANTLGEVPVALVPNHGRLDGSFTAEHEPVLPLLDLYNKTLLDMATTSEFAAFPQRYGIGVELDEGEEPTTLEGLDVLASAPALGPLAQYRAAVDSMITTPSPDAQFGQFQAADLSTYVKALEQIVSTLGTITFIPFHVLLNMPTAVPATGEALKAAEAGHVANVKDHQREKGGAWERAVRLALRAAGRADSPALEAIWKPAETLSEAVHTDALTKLGSDPVGLPTEAVWELLPASPQQIARWKRMLEAEAAAAPPAPAQPPGTPEVPPPAATGALS
jgi:hypothetical protein